MEKRIYKFRAWDKEKKLMRINNLYPKSDINSFFADVSHLEVMQFTGLLDKNGKEIYESDVIGGTSYKSNAPVKGVVEYEAGCFGVVSNTWGYYLADLKNLEVIGNIYENPERLKN